VGRPGRGRDRGHVPVRVVAGLDHSEVGEGLSGDPPGM
jgi:hypothetical protein